MPSPGGGANGAFGGGDFFKWSDMFNMFNIFGDNNSASSVSDNYYLNKLYLQNSVWAEEQAQKQMDFQTSANRIAMDFSAAEAEKQRAFETDMANTAYQRAVQDLKKAGLNPILAYSQGGAAVPSVNSASGVTSAGSKASMSDTGYNAARLSLEEQKFKVNSALSALRLFLGFTKNS